MSCFSWLRSRTAYRAPRNRALQRPAAPRFRPRLEALEDRALPSTYFAATTSDLIADINAANKAGGANSITLTAPTTSPYVLTAVDNTTNGANGLPVISGGGKKAAADNLTIVGNGDTIERTTASGTPAFRPFDVAKGSSLALENVTLQGGLASGSGAAADGGAIYNQGTLTMTGASVQGNVAQGNNGASGATTTTTSTKKRVPNINGQAGADAAGGGIWSSGTVTLEGGSSLQGNKALGGQGGAGGWQRINGVFLAGNGGAGGSGFGGGLYEAGGNVNVTDATLSTNTAQGGTGGDVPLGIGTTRAAAGAGGAGSGGGLYVAGGTLDMMGNPQNSTLVTVESNKALGGDGGKAFFADAPGKGGEGSGGGISLADANTATLAYVELLNNTAQGGNGGSTTSGHRAGAGGSAFGGGLYMANGAVTLTNDTVNGNDAIGGWGGSPFGNTDFSGGTVRAAASGGGIYIVGGTVSLDSYTVANTNGNYDDNDPFMLDNIDGPYTLI